MLFFFNFEVKWTTMDLQTRKIEDSINGQVIERNDGVKKLLNILPQLFNFLLFQSK